jgi:hypothetical protein
MTTPGIKHTTHAEIEELAAIYEGLTEMTFTGTIGARRMIQTAINYTVAFAQAKGYNVDAGDAEWQEAE